MYTVPVIPPDLRHEETIIQAANALSCLQSTITNIFDRIDKRISRNNEKINELSSRVSEASQKIQNLSDTKKAIKIFSPAKFPSSQVFRDIVLTFNDAEEVDLRSSILSDREIMSRVDLVPSNIQEKLVFFHFRNASAKNKSIAARVSSHCGLGEIPTNSKSINSVLLFTTGENVYGAHKSTGEMSRVQRNRNKGAKKAEIGTGRGLIIEPAPLSLSNRQKGAEKRQQGLFYTPMLNEAPTIDLPADLPDLPGIAGDIQFNHDETSQIAPSLFFESFLDMPKVPEVPEMPGVVENTDSKLIETTSQLNAMEPTTKTLITSTSPVPPPPPPPPVMPDVKPISSPPPPPAPPMNIPTSSVPSKAAPEVDIRSNLMDAIRKAGGARGGRLRAAADVVRQTSTDQLDAVPGKPKIATGGDLMADLHNKLLMRRKGISGAKDGQATSTDGGSVMSRLSSLIPPPPVKRQESSSDEDDAGDDTDWAD